MNILKKGQKNTLKKYILLHFFGQIISSHYADKMSLGSLLGFMYKRDNFEAEKSVDGAVGRLKR